MHLYRNIYIQKQNYQANHENYLHTTDCSSYQNQVQVQHNDCSILRIDSSLQDSVNHLIFTISVPDKLYTNKY